MTDDVYDPAAIELLQAMPPRKVPPVEHWQREDWLRAVHQADEDIAERARLLTLLGEAYPAATRCCRTVLDYWEWTLSRPRD